MSNIAAEGGSLVDRAVARVREHIFNYDLKVGDTLPGEGRFASDLGVSRAVMREAFGALSALHVIDVANGRRARVGAIDGSVMATSIDHAVSTSQVSVADVWEVRRTLELRTVELAANGRSDADAALILAAAEGMATAGDDLINLARCDLALHQTIAKASGNPLYFQIVRSFQTLMDVAIPKAWQTRETPAQRMTMLKLHRAMAEAIALRDAKAAVAAMDSHFDNSIGDLIKARN